MRQISKIASRCLAALAFAAILTVHPAPGGAQDLRAENAALRAKVAQLQAELAALTAKSCGPDAGQTEAATGLRAVDLIRKLSQQQRSAAEHALGLAPGPVIIPDSVLGAVIPGEYIVLLEGPPATTAAQAAARIGVAPEQIVHLYRQALPGFAARLTPQERDTAQAAPGVTGVVQNGYVFASGFAAGGGMRAGDGSHGLHRPKSPVHLAQARPLVDVYVFDTGIRAAHRDLTGRVSDRGFSFFDNGIAGEDCSGHGTHVAARIAGITLGTSTHARLVSVKVIDRFGTGDVATVIAGIDWVLQQPTAPGAHKLVNMSLTRRVTQSPSVLDLAVQRLIDAGALVVVAAGNASADAQDYTPARIPGAITVGAADPVTGLAEFSNAGESVDIYAPGEAITSASIRDVCGVHVMSGTSMSAPYVTGLMATMLFEGAPPDTVLERLRAGALRIATGAFSGEQTRWILPAARAAALPCQPGPQ